MDVDSPEDLSAIGRELEAMLLAGDVPEAPERWSPVPPSAEQAAATPVATQPISLNQAPPALNINTFTNPVTGQTVNYDSIAVISATTSQQPQTNYESPRHSAPPPPDFDAPQGDAPRPPPNPDDAPVPVGNPAAQVPTSAYALSPGATRPAYGSLVSTEVSAPASEAQARGPAYGSLVSAEVSAQASGASGAPATEVSATGARRPAYGTVITADGSGAPPADHPLAVPGFFAEPVAAGSVVSDQQQAPKTGAGELSLDALSSSLGKATPDRSTGSLEPRSGLDGSGSASGTMGATGGGDEISASPRTSVDGASPRADGPGVPPSAIRGGAVSPPAMGSPTAIRVVGMDDKTLIRTPTARRITGAKLRGDGPHKIFKVSLEGTGQHGFVTLDYPNGTTMQAVLRYVITKRKLPEDVYSLRYAKSALTGQVTDLPPEMTVGQLEDVNLAIVGKTSGHRVVEKSGHLKMVGSNALRRRVWKRRWFVLKNNRLGSHAKEFDKMIHSIDLDLLDPEAVEPASSQVDGKKKKAKKQETGLFSITIPPGAISAHSDKDMREVKVGGKSSKEKDVVIHLRAADDEQRDDWIKVLRSSIERHRVKKSFPAETTSPNTRTSEAEGPSEPTSELSELSTGDSSSVGPAADNSDVTVADFELLHVVGKGSFGKVLQVRHKYSGQIYAMKVLAKKSIIANDEIEAAVTERNVLEQLVHPFLVTLYFSFQTADKLYFIMDFINGGELLHYLEMEESLTPDRIRFYSAEIVLALEYLHSCGVVYRDLKPENVLINFDGHVILTDFGLSKMGLAEDERTMTLCGTPDYIAPEIIMSEYTQKGYGKPVDIWSLGCLIFEMYTGTTPFYSPNMQETFTMIARNELKIPANVSDPATRNLLEGLLQKQEERRVTIDQIKQHVYFETVNWDALLQKQVKPPFVPEVKSKSDVSQIAEEFLAEPANTDPDSDSEEEVDDAMMDDAEAFFSGFLTFVSPEQPKEESRG